MGFLSGYLDGLLALPGPGHPGDREDPRLHRAPRGAGLGQHRVRDDLGGGGGGGGGGVREVNGGR